MLGLLMAVLTSSSPRARERPFTLVVMPDVQYYIGGRQACWGAIQGTMPSS